MDIADKQPWLVAATNKLWLRLTRPTWAMIGLAFVALVGLAWLQAKPGPPPAPAGQIPDRPARQQLRAGPETCSGFFESGPARKAVFSIQEFGGVGDGRTSNTEAFRRAMSRAGEFSGKGGAQLNVPAGRWVTGSFNLTSDLTLFLEEGAVILGSQVFSISRHFFFYESHCYCLCICIRFKFTDFSFHQFCKD